MMDDDAFDATNPTDERASALEPGMIYREYGMDVAIVARRGDHGDMVLITTTDGLETSFDNDTVIEISPVTDERLPRSLAWGDAS